MDGSILPKQILIDSVLYDVDFTDGPIICKGIDSRGSCDFNKAKILISSENAGEGRFLQILMHEVMHALLYERGLEKDCDNEVLVEQLASGISVLMMDNPMLVDYIMRWSRGGE